MKVSKEGYLKCGVCGYDHMHLIGIIEAYDNDSYELTKLVINKEHIIKPDKKIRYEYRSQGNVHLLYRCEEGHFSITSFDGHKGIVVVNQNPLMDALTGFLNEKTKEQREEGHLGFQMDFTILSYIEQFLSSDIV